MYIIMKIRVHLVTLQDNKDKSKKNKKGMNHYQKIQFSLLNLRPNQFHSHYPQSYDYQSSLTCSRK